VNGADRFIIGVLFALMVGLLFHRQFPAYDPSAGRRPIVAVPPTPALPLPPVAVPGPPPRPVPERVRRPRLEEPDTRDPTFTVDTLPIHSDSTLIGTAFSVDRHGVWITARHVASEVCQLLILVVNGRPQPATIAYVHPESDLTVLQTRDGAPAMPLSSDRPAVGETGFSFGYPTGVLGATEDTLMGRSRMQFAGRMAGATPTLTWAESQRFPETLETLGGMSGGPMLDQEGRIVGSVVAATTRRGRVHTVAPELLNRVGRETGLFDPATPLRPVAEIAQEPGELSAIATALNQNSRIAKVYCKVR
jgi:serine protease Do